MDRPARAVLLNVHNSKDVPVLGNDAQHQLPKMVSTDGRSQSVYAICSVMASLPSRKILMPTETYEQL